MNFPFHNGQKVVALRGDDEAPLDEEKHGLVKNAVYTVLAQKEKISEPGEFGVQLFEITLPPGWWFYAYLFRPLDERKTDI